MLTTTPVLAYYHATKSTVVSSDAYSYGLGGALYNEHWPKLSKNALQGSDMWVVPLAACPLRIWPWQSDCKMPAVVNVSDEVQYWSCSRPRKADRWDWYWSVAEGPICLYDEEWVEECVCASQQVSTCKNKNIGCSQRIAPIRSLLLYSFHLSIHTLPRFLLSTNMLLFCCL